MTRTILILSVLVAAALAVATLVVLHEPEVEAPEGAPEAVEPGADTGEGIHELELPPPDADREWESLLSGDDAGEPDISPDGFYRDMEESFRSIARPGELEREDVPVQPKLTPLPEPVADREDADRDDDDGDP